MQESISLHVETTSLCILAWLQDDEYFSCAKKGNNTKYFNFFYFYVKFSKQELNFCMAIANMEAMEILR